MALYLIIPWAKKIFSQGARLGVNNGFTRDQTILHSLVHSYLPVKYFFPGALRYRTPK